MAESSRQATSHRDAVRKVRDAQSFAVQLPVLGRVRLPRPEQLAFYGALGVLAAAEIIEWPVALVLATGHLLIHEEHNRVAQEIGEALEEV
ncbi:hypothetical protein [Mycobacterium sp. NAZ190054]|uniref:hypothetical protein n=1 Tax=Mycobacterium sp. NAZ190054 TaxID=1747766 RepID=UPI00079B206E|nr:hypothetical protein [Mycobacterium sp. NAZ190054]KWX56767.1 hypothetical protein ASJ79_13530 [Mycobacterium sp. NAZ190054]